MRGARRVVLTAGLLPKVAARAGSTMTKWVLDQSDGRLVSGKYSTALTPKAAAILAFLIKRRGDVVSRDEIIAQVWDGVHVKPDIVREYIFDIRAALLDDAADPRQIETIRGRGYRLIGDVGVAQRSVGVARNLPVVAVLRPVTFAPTESNWQILAESLVEDLTTDLAGFADIAVVARQSAFALANLQDIRDVARQLGANYVVESSLAVGDDTVRLNLQLIDARTGQHVWAVRRDVPLAGVPLLSEQAALEIANAIGGWRGEVQRADMRRATCRSRATFSAYEHYLLAVHNENIYSRETLPIAVEHAERAIALDPNHARTWLLLWFLYRGRARFEKYQAADFTARAQSAIERAYELEQRDPKILCEIGRYRAICGDLHAADTLIRRAADLGSNQAYAAALAAAAMTTIVGDVIEARRLIDTAMRLNPFGPLWYRVTDCGVAYFSGQFERCLERSAAVRLTPLGALWAALSSAMMNAPDLSEAKVNLFAQYPSFDPVKHVRSHPIIHAGALERFEEGVARLDLQSAPERT